MTYIPEPGLPDFEELKNQFNYSFDSVAFQRNMEGLKINLDDLKNQFNFSFDSGEIRRNMEDTKKKANEQV